MQNLLRLDEEDDLGLFDGVEEQTEVSELVGVEEDLATNRRLEPVLEEPCVKRGVAFVMRDENREPTLLPRHRRPPTAMQTAPSASRSARGRSEVHGVSGARG